MKKCKKYILLLCAVLTLLLAACSADGQKRQITPEELDPTLNQEIDPDKEILIYARTSRNDGSWFNRQAVDEFNRSHDDIQILVKDYYGSEEDKAQGYERLRSEMAAGQVPDIIDLAGVSYSQAIQKGYLEDLWPYIENDPDLGRDGVLEAPLKAAEVNGGLYAAFGAVTVDTLLGTASQVGDRTSWTFQEIQDAFEAMPEGATLLQFDASREMIAGILMHLSLENYVDQEAGTCSFDSPGFRSMLEFVSRFPTQKEVEEETAVFADDFARWKEAEERFVSGLQMLDNSQYVALTSLQKLNARHSGQCAFIGYPVEDGSTGSIFRLTGQCIAMSSTCKNKEAAWEFMRTVYTEPKDGTPDNNSAIPIWKVLYDKQKDTLMHTEQEIVPFLFTQQQFVTAPPLAAEEVRRFEDFINSIGKIELIGEQDLFSLVMEVCAPCFSGDKSLDETVSLLDNRVGLYLSEQH